jgi:hypothetical protein
LLRLALGIDLLKEFFKHLFLSANEVLRIFFLLLFNILQYFDILLLWNGLLIFLI